MHEKRLPLWLIKGYEENARRAALVAAAEAAREAAKGAPGCCASSFDCLLFIWLSTTWQTAVQLPCHVNDWQSDCIWTASSYAKLGLHSCIAKLVRCRMPRSACLVNGCAAAEATRAKAAAVKAAAAAKGTPRDKAPASESSAASDAGDACGICQKAFGEVSDEDDLWIACDECNQWYHGTCAGATQVGFVSPCCSLHHLTGYRLLDAQQSE